MRLSFIPSLAINSSASGTSLPPVSVVPKASSPPGRGTSLVSRPSCRSTVPYPSFFASSSVPSGPTSGGSFDSADTGFLRDLPASRAALRSALILSRSSADIFLGLSSSPLSLDGAVGPDVLVFTDLPASLAARRSALIFSRSSADIFFGFSLPSSDSPSFPSSFGSSGGLGRPVISLTFARISSDSGLSPTQAWAILRSGPTTKTPRRPGEVEGFGRLGDPDGDQRSGGEVDLILLQGQRLEVLDVLFVSRPVEGDHDRSPRGPHAQPELASLGAGQVELGGLGSDLRHRLGFRACKHTVLLASMKNRTRAYYSLWRLLARAGCGRQSQRGIMDVRQTPMESCPSLRV